TKNNPPNNNMRSRPENVQSKTVIRGFVNVTNHEIANNNPNRINNASERPSTRALSRCSGGSFSAKMAIKTRLSIPSTISKIINVSKPTQIPGSNKNSISSLPHSGL